ncbi:MAG: hypothetical protein OSB57_15490, partial [Planctomycetota bacterium]|nr:hypothetical protein [Planctomycetota bacterium]
MPDHPDSIVPQMAPGQHTVGWVPHKVQYGGKSGLGEGEPFIAYEWANGGTWQLPQMEHFKMALRSVLLQRGDTLDQKANPYAPWHEHVSNGNEFLNNWNKVGDGADRTRNQLFRQLSALGEHKDVFGSEVGSPYYGRGQVPDPLQEIRLKMNLWQVRDKAILKQIFFDSTSKSRQVDRGLESDDTGTYSSYEAKSKQYIASTDDPSKGTKRWFTDAGFKGGKRIISGKLDRVFYPAILDLIERKKLGAELEVVDKDEDGLFDKTVEEISRTAAQFVGAGVTAAAGYVLADIATRVFGGGGLPGGAPIPNLAQGQHMVDNMVRFQQQMDVFQGYAGVMGLINGDTLATLRMMFWENADEAFRVYDLIRPYMNRGFNWGATNANHWIQNILYPAFQQAEVVGRAAARGAAAAAGQQAAAAAGQAAATAGKVGAAVGAAAFAASEVFKKKKKRKRAKRNRRGTASGSLSSRPPDLDAIPMGITKAGLKHLPDHLRRGANASLGSLGSLGGWGSPGAHPQSPAPEPVLDQRPPQSARPGIWSRVKTRVAAQKKADAARATAQAAGISKPSPATGPKPQPVPPKKPDLPPWPHPDGIEGPPNLNYFGPEDLAHHLRRPAKKKKKRRKITQFTRQAMSSSMSSLAQMGLGNAATVAGASVGGAVGGTVGASIGGIAARGSLAAGSKRMTDWMMGVKRSKPTAGELERMTKESMRSRGGSAAGPATLGALSAMLYNAASGRNWDAAHIPHESVADMYGMMNYAQRGLLNDVRASQVGFLGELTVPGDPRGSFNGYWARMILTDQNRAERLLRPLINTGNLGQEAHAARLARSYILKFYMDHRPNLFRNVGLAAAA